MSKYEITQVLKDLPVQKPYCDWDAIKAVTPATLRYDLAQKGVKKDSGYYDIPDEYDENRLPEFEVARWMAAKVLKQIIADKGLSGKQISENTGIDTAIISHMINGNRSFNVEPSRMEALREFTGMSCHELLFGEEGKVILPQRYSILARELSLLPGETIEKLLEESGAAYKEYCSGYGENFSPMQHKSYTELMWQRIGCIKDDNLYNQAEIFGRGGETPYQMKSALTLFWDKERKPQYEPKLQFVMYASLSTGLALDYFVAERFEKYVPMYYTDGEKTIKIKDKKLIGLIADIMAVDDERQQELFSSALCEVIKTKIR